MSVQKKVATRQNATNGGNGTSLPPEAYQFDADVTPEAVETVRERARPLIESEEWELIDGFRATSTNVGKPAPFNV
jgi:hypothetical protein